MSSQLILRIKHNEKITCSLSNKRVVDISWFVCREQVERSFKKKEWVLPHTGGESVYETLG